MMQGISLWAAVPAALVYECCGIAAGTAIFYKLSCLVEYILVKKYGDYDPQNLRWAWRTDEEKDCIIISPPTNTSYGYVQDVAVAILFGITAGLAYSSLIAVGCPTFVATHFLVGSVVFCVLTTVYNVKYSTNTHPRLWRILDAEEANTRGIKMSTLQHLGNGEWVNAYTSFGAAPMQVFTPLGKDKWRNASKPIQPTAT